MRIAALALAVAVLASLAPAHVGAQSGPLQVGATVSKDVTLKDIYGKDHTLGQYRGRIVFIHFWSIVCPTEKFAEPKFVELHKQFGDQVVQIAIDANQRELKADTTPPYADIRKHVEEAALPFIVTVDHGNKVTDVLGGTNTPHCFVIDKDGVLQYSGALDDDPRGSKGAQATPYVKNAIEALAAGRPVPVATTKPYG